MPTKTKEEKTRSGKLFDLSQNRKPRLIMTAVEIVSIILGIFMFFAHIDDSKVDFWIFAIIFVAFMLLLATTLTLNSKKALTVIAVVLGITVVASAFAPIYYRYNKDSAKQVQCEQAPCKASYDYYSYYGIGPFGPVERYPDGVEQ